MISKTDSAQWTDKRALSSSESRRNRKTQALSALLSATALGVFLEGCNLLSDDGSSRFSSTPPIGPVQNNGAAMTLERYTIAFATELTTDIKDRALDSLGYGFASKTILAKQITSNEIDFYDSEGGLISVVISVGAMKFSQVYGDDYYSLLKDGKGNVDYTVIIRAENTLLRTNNIGAGGGWKISIYSSASSVASNLANGEEGIQSESAISGSDQPDYLVGDDTAQSFFGSGGDDILEGRGGVDTIDGGEGTDTASYASSASGVIVNLATQEARGGDASGDTLVSIENLVGSQYQDELTGDEKPNALYGLGGNDEIRGGAGNDLLVGGKGDDDLYGGAGNDRYFVSPDEGADTIVDTEGNNEVYFLSDSDSKYVAVDFDADNFARNGDDLVIGVTKGGTPQQVTIEDYFVSIADNVDAFTIFYGDSAQGSDYTEVTAVDIASYV